MMEGHGHGATEGGLVAVAGVVDGEVLGQLREAAVQRPGPLDGPGQAALQLLHHAADARLRLAAARPPRLVHGAAARDYWLQHARHLVHHHHRLASLVVAVAAATAGMAPHLEPKDLELNRHGHFFNY